MRTRRGLETAWAVLVGVVILSPTVPAADAYEIRGGLSLGGILVGTVPRFSVSPHGGIAWSSESGLLLELHNVCNLVPATGRLGFGVYDQASVAVGVASTKIDISLGPSFAFYSLPACGATLCGRVTGLAPGVQVATNLYVAPKLGISLNASLDWVGGNSLVLPGGWAARVVVGPVIRWSAR